MCTYLLYCFSSFSCFSPSMKARLFPPKAGSAWGLMWRWVKRGVLWVTTNTSQQKTRFTNIYIFYEEFDKAISEEDIPPSDVPLPLLQLNLCNFIG